MRNSFPLILVLMAACVPSRGEQVTARTVDQKWLQTKSLSLAVLDIHANANPIDPVVLQMNLAQELRELGYTESRTQAVGRKRTPWKTGEAAQAAQSTGHDGALVLSFHNEEGLLHATLRVIDRTGTVRYDVEVEFPADGLNGEALASKLLAPLERIL